MISAVSGCLGDRLGSLGTKRTSFWASGRPKTLLHPHKDATLPSFDRRAQSPGAHVAVAIGGDRKAAILCMISANNCRGIATSAIWNVT